MKLPIVILISGNGSNLQAIVDATSHELDVNILAVISNRADAYGLSRARYANIPTHVIKNESELRTQIDYYKPKLIVLAGFMRLLTPSFVEYYEGRIINIHPSLLPKYPGLNTHRRVLDAKETYHGATVHFVTAEMDAGPIICQSKLIIDPKDSEETLKQRVQQLEHELYPKALSLIVEGKVSDLTNLRSI